MATYDINDGDRTVEADSFATSRDGEFTDFIDAEGRNVLRMPNKLIHIIKRTSE